MTQELVYDLAAVAAGGAETFRATDPLVNPNPYASPGDFAAQYPTPVDTTELIAMCEEVTALQWLMATEEVQGLKQITWRELNELAFTSGSVGISFADGDCPNEFRADGDPTSYDLKNIGAKKTLTLSDILHSAASRAAGYGMAAIGGTTPWGEGIPGAFQTPQVPVQMIADIKAKTIIEAEALIGNGWDNLLINGDDSVNSLQFNGIIDQLTGSAAHTNDNSGSGSYSATDFDRWLTESCAKPQVLLLHPSAASEVLAAYFQLLFQGSQIISKTDQEGIVPGFNFAGFVNTAVGRLTLVADNNVPRVNIGSGKFQSKIYALRMIHQGVKLVYMITQIPVGYQDLAPGCTAIAFEIWGKTGVVVKHKCAHGIYTSQFTGRILTTCPVIL
jgi:hypothetical protein